MWVVIVAPTAAAVWDERACEVAGDAVLWLRRTGRRICAYRVGSTLTSRATHAHPTSPRSTGFCAIWGCISSSSSSSESFPIAIAAAVCVPDCMRACVRNRRVPPPTFALGRHVKDGHVNDMAQDAAQDATQGVLDAAEDGGVAVFIVARVIFQRRNPRPTRASCRPPFFPWAARKGRARKGRGEGRGEGRTTGRVKRRGA